MYGVMAYEELGYLKHGGLLSMQTLLWNSTACECHSKASLYPCCSRSFLVIVTHHVKIFCCERQWGTQPVLLGCHWNCCMHCKRAPERHVARGHQQIGVIVFTKGVLLKLYAWPATSAKCREALHLQIDVHDIAIHSPCIRISVFWQPLSHETFCQDLESKGT